MMRCRLRVLVVDDHPGMLRAVCRLLELDYDVVGTLAAGAGLLEAAQHLRPDAIVLDLNLPDSDGLTLCRQVMEKHPRIKVILFTAMEDPEIRRAAFEAGAAAFVHKLALDDDLLSALQRLDADRD
jgi:two-component system, NarL family, response regulator DevR